jgi:hypothetical protein
VLRAITVKRPAKMAAMEKIQKNTDSQPDKIIIKVMSDGKVMSNE